MEHSTDDNSLDFFLSEKSDIGMPFQKLIERHKIEGKEEAKDEHIFSELPIKNQVNKWVLVLFKTKATIKPINKCGRRLPSCEVCKMDKKTSVFVWPQGNDEGEIQ